MALIGNRVGIATIAGHNISGLTAWLIWRAYYISKIPTFGKKLNVAVDWFTDCILARDVTHVGVIKKKEIHANLLLHKELVKNKPRGAYGISFRTI